MTSRNKRIAGLYVLTDPGAGTTDDLLSRTDAALRGGATMIQYRDKTQDARRRRREAAAILAQCRHHDAIFIVNDDVDLAAEVGADGVHLGRDDASLQQARNQLGPDAIIGVSCYASLAKAKQAEADSASYVAFGSFFPSRIKPAAVRAPINLLQEARRQLHIPIVAIGGIDQNNASALIKAGADAIAVVSAVILAEQPAQEARELARLFDSQ